MENMDGSERVMVISPHPDDVDFGCSGTIAGWSRMGMNITYVICTSGDKGTDFPVEPEAIAGIREKEQLAAAEIVGVRKVVFLRLKDGELENNREFRKTLVRALRQYRPDAGTDRALQYQGGHGGQRTGRDIQGGIVLLQAHRQSGALLPQG